MCTNCSASWGGLKAKDANELEPRARQNVYFEAGYFAGALRRARLMFLARPSVRQPSDLDGIVWVELDDKGAWKGKMVKELDAAGIALDAKKVIELG